MATENNLEVDESTAVPTPTEAFTDEVKTQSYSAEDLSKARAQEKAKLYPQVEKLQEELSILRKKEEEREAKDAERRAARQAREAEAAAEKKKAEEAELGFKELLAKKEEELQAQIAEERAERQKALALLDQERRFQEVTTFRQTRLEQERDSIIPELIDLISGNSEDEIEQSISALKTKSAKIFESVATASQQTRKEMVGSRVTMPASGPLDNDSAQANLSPENIANMSLADYAKNRTKLLGTTNNRGGQGLFG